jgi:hypothetical protein
MTNVINTELVEGIAASSREATAAIQRLQEGGIIPQTVPEFIATASNVGDFISQHSGGEAFNVMPELGNTDVQRLAQIVLRLSKQIHNLEGELLHSRNLEEPVSDELNGEERAAFERLMHPIIFNAEAPYLRRTYSRSNFREIEGNKRLIIAELLVERFRELEMEPDSLWIGITVNNGVL